MESRRPICLSCPQSNKRGLEETPCTPAPWVMVRKPTSSHDLIARGVKPRTVIHDDDSARALGYRAGIVGGHTLAALTWAAIPASLGQDWYQGGVYSVRNKNVSYEGEVRAVWESIAPDAGDSRKIAFHIENRAGDTSTYGWAATAEPGREFLTPWQRNPSPRGIVGEDVSPDVVVGASHTPFELVVHPENVMERDQHAWYRIASPFGGPLLSPLDIASVFYHGRRLRPVSADSSVGGPVRASMDAGTDLAVYEPVFLDRAYVIGAKVVAKWQTAKTAFSSTEYTFTDKETGSLVAVSRNYSAYMIPKVAPIAATA